MRGRVWTSARRCVPAERERKLPMHSERAKDTGGDERPDPEELLDRYALRDTAPIASSGSAGTLARAEDEMSSDSHRPRRGRLRVYLGMAAGVGKTYAMLNEGRRRK